MPGTPLRSMPLLVMLLAAIAGCATNAGADTVTQHATAADLADYASHWQQARVEAYAGDRGKALDAFAHLLDDARFKHLEADEQSRYAQLAAWTALMHGEPASARRFIQAALEATPGDHKPWVALSSIDLAEGLSEKAADHLVHAASLTRSGLVVNEADVDYLQYTLRDQPQRRQALLQALFNANWKTYDLEPVRMWVHLATAQAEAAQHDAVRATLARIDTPLELIQLRSDARFDAYLDPGDPRFDPQQALQRHMARVRAAIAVERPIDPMLGQYALMLLLSGRNDDVVAFTDPMAALAAGEGGGSAAGAQWLSLLLAYRGKAQAWLGQTEQALASTSRAAQIGAHSDAAGERQLGLAYLQIALDRARTAQETLAEPQAGEGAGWTLARYLAARQTGNAMQAAAARAQLAAQRDSEPYVYLEVLLAEGHLDAAASVLAALLRSPYDRGETLARLQEYQRHASLPGDARADRHWQALKQRPDVRAEIARVGRVQQYSLYQYEASR